MGSGLREEGGRSSYATLHRHLVSVEEPLPGVHLIERRPIGDERGSFCRMFCAETMRAMGVDDHVAQANLSQSRERGTLRGLHYQVGPSAETKIVSCVTGCILDCVVDLRPDSPGFCKHALFTISAENRCAVVVPKGCAHGFMTLEPNSSVLYFVSTAYDPGSERGVRFDDPALAIDWPMAPAVISARDRSHPDLDRLNPLI